MTREVCPGAVTRINRKPHPFCRGTLGTPACDLWLYACEMLPGAIKPALVDSYGVVTCPNKVHAQSIGAAPGFRHP